MVDYWTGPWQVSWAKETTPGTEVSPTTWLGICPTFTPKEKRVIKRFRHAGQRDFFIQTQGKYEFPFSFEYFPQDGKFLVMVLGSVTDSGTGPYTHTIDPADQLPTFTFEAAIPGGSFVRRYIGCKVDKVTISCVEGEDLKISVDCIAMDIAKYTAATSITELTTEPYEFDVSALTLGATSVGTMKSFSWSFANNIKLDHAYHMGNAKPTYLPEGGRVNDLTIELHPEDTSWWDNWKADPQTAIDGSVLFTRGTGDTIELKWLTMLYEDANIELPEETGEYLQKLSLKPKTCQIIVVDDTATYP